MKATKTSEKYPLRVDLENRFDPKELASLRENFGKFDENGDGDIDCAELMKVMQALGMPCDREAANKLLKMGDKDGDGCVNFEEFAEFIFNSQRVSSTPIFFESLSLVIHHQMYSIAP